MFARETMFTQNQNQTIRLKIRFALYYSRCGYAKKTHSYLYQLRRSFQLGIKKIRKIYLYIFMNNITFFSQVQVCRRLEVWKKSCWVSSSQLLKGFFIKYFVPIVMQRRKNVFAFNEYHVESQDLHLCRVCKVLEFTMEIFSKI